MTEKPIEQHFPSLPILVDGPISYGDFLQKNQFRRKQIFRWFAPAIVVVFGLNGLGLLLLEVAFWHLVVAYSVLLPLVMWACFWLMGGLKTRKHFDQCFPIKRWSILADRITCELEDRSDKWEFAKNPLWFGSCYSVAKTDSHLFVTCKGGNVMSLPKRGFKSTQEFDLAYDRINSFIETAPKAGLFVYRMEQETELCLSGSYGKSESDRVLSAVQKLHEGIPSNYYSWCWMLFLFCLLPLAVGMCFVPKPIAPGVILCLLALTPIVVSMWRFEKLEILQRQTKPLFAWTLTKLGIVTTGQGSKNCEFWEDIESVLEVDEGLLVYFKTKNVLLVPRSVCDTVENWELTKSIIGRHVEITGCPPVLSEQLGCG